MENANANVFGIMLQIKLQKETNMTRQREAQENGIKLSFDELRDFRDLFSLLIISISLPEVSRKLGRQISCIIRKIITLSLFLCHC